MTPDDGIKEKVVIWGTVYDVVWSLKQWPGNVAQAISPPKLSGTVSVKAEKPPATVSRKPMRKEPKGVRCRYPVWMTERLEEFKRLRK